MLESLISESQGPVVVENVVSLTTPDLGGDFSGALVSFPLDVSLQSCGEETRHPLEFEPPEVQLPSGMMVLFTQETDTHDSETHNDWAFQDTRTQHITNMGAVPGKGVVPLRVAPSQSLLGFPKGEGLKGVERGVEKIFSSVSTWFGGRGPRPVEGQARRGLSISNLLSTHQTSFSQGESGLQAGTQTAAAGTQAAAAGTQAAAAAGMQAATAAAAADAAAGRQAGQQVQAAQFSAAIFDDTETGDPQNWTPEQGSPGLRRPSRPTPTGSEEDSANKKLCTGNTNTAGPENTPWTQATRADLVLEARLANLETSVKAELAMWKSQVGGLETQLKQCGQVIQVVVQNHRKLAQTVTLSHTGLQDCVARLNKIEQDLGATRSVTAGETQKLRHELAKIQQDLRSVYGHLDYTAKTEETKQVELAQKLAQDALGLQQLQVGLNNVVGQIHRQAQMEVALEQLQAQVGQGHRSRSHTPPQQVRPRKSRTVRRPPSSETSESEPETPKPPPKSKGKSTKQKASDSNPTPQEDEVLELNLVGDTLGSEIHLPIRAPQSCSIGSRVRVAPVAVASGGTLSELNGLAWDPVLAALAKSALRPTFSGAQKDWPSFLENWEAYWAKITGGEPKSDKIKLTLFVDSLDTTSQKEMEREQKFQGAQFTYAQVLARLEARFGLGRQSLCKQDFENLSCGEGKMSLEDWHKFRVDFLTLVSEMGKSDEVACEDLKRKLPKGMAHWVAKKEVKLENEFPSVEVTMPQAFNLPSLKGFITRFSGYEPTSLVDLGGNKWRVAWNNRTAVENMLSRNNFKVEIGNQVAGKVRVQPAETRLTLEETVKLITERLDTNARKEMKMSQKEKGFRKEKEHWRRTQVVEVVPKKKTHPRHI